MWTQSKLRQSEIQGFPGTAPVPVLSRLFRFPPPHITSPDSIPVPQFGTLYRIPPPPKHSPLWRQSGCCTSFQRPGPQSKVRGCYDINIVIEALIIISKRVLGPIILCFLTRSLQNSIGKYSGPYIVHVRLRLALSLTAGMAAQ